MTPRIPPRPLASTSPMFTPCHKRSFILLHSPRSSMLHATGSCKLRAASREKSACAGLTVISGGAGTAVPDCCPFGLHANIDATTPATKRATTETTTAAITTLELLLPCSDDGGGGGNGAPMDDGGAVVHGIVAVVVLFKRECVVKMCIDLTKQITMTHTCSNGNV